MISNIYQSPLQSYSSIEQYVRINGSPRPLKMHYASADDSIHYEDGFRKYVHPEVGENQRLGPFVFWMDEDVVTREVYDLSPEEIEERTKNQVLAQAESDRFQKLEEAKEKAIMDTFHAISDPTEALENQAIFPLWSGESVAVKAGEKYQAFDGLELKLFEVIQPHTTQEGWHPVDTPALWLRVALPDQILPWVQPTGAHDAYNIADRVSYQGQNWESTVNANVYPPGVVAGQWVVV